MATIWKKNIAKRIALLETKLIAKNRELEIESAVERVRAKALAMHRSEEILEVVVAMRSEFQLLKIPGVGAATITLKQEDGSIRLWDITSADHYNDRYRSSMDVVFRLKENHPRFYLNRIWKSKKKYFVAEQTKIDFPITINWLRKFDRAAAADLKRVLKENKIKHSWHPAAKLSHGWLNLDSSFAPAPEMKTILLKMAAAFDLAYKRFLDLKKAESQAREAQIEVAVERVRAKALAMHASDEIHEVVRTLRNELFGLELEGIIGATICLKQEDGQVRLWDITDVDTTGRYGWDIVFDMNKIDPRIWVKKIWDSRKKIIAIEQDANDLKRTLKWLGRYDKKTADEITKLLKKNKINHGWHRAVKLSDGILITDFFNEPPSEIDPILLKMGAAFDLAYKRFLDLQNAEAQAREARIQAALETVRSRSLAMHKSDELKEVVAVLFQKLQELDFEIDKGAAIVLTFSPGSKDHTQWITDATQTYAVPFLVPFTKHTISQDQYNARKKGFGFYSKLYEQKEIRDYFGYLFKHTAYNQVPQTVRKMILDSKKYGLSIAFEKNSAIAIPSTIGKLVSGDEAKILKRFSKVFEQSYTRFLDLQKAEAQAKEAQVEAGLERVRSKTMAMHKSSEVTGIAVSLNEELLKLGFEGGSTILIMDKETGDTEQWTGFSEIKTLKSCFVPHFRHPYHDALFDNWKNGEKFLVYTVAGKEKKSLDAHYFSTGYKIFPESDKKWMKQMRSVTFSHAFMKYGAIHWGPDHLTEEQLRVLERFSKVFAQSYTRFLDLQKAEAQAREAQVQLSLERVRARAMAMYHSDELNDVLSVLFEQFDALGINPVFTHLSLFDFEKNLITLRITGKGGKRSMAQKTVAIDAMDEWKEELANWKASKPSSFSRIYYPKKVFPQIWNLFGDLFDQLPGDSKIYPDDFPGGLYCMQGNTGYGYIGLNHIRETTDEEKDIILRFATEFGRVYQRFLDLQKAEAQAREVEIELALERVRARTMAMHKSDELSDVSALLYKELQGLGVTRFINCGYVEIDEANNIQNAWMTIADGSGVNAVQLPLTGDKVFDERYDAWKRKEKIFHQSVGGDLLKSHIEFATQHYRKTAIDEMVRIRFADPTIFYCSNFSHGYLHIVTDALLSEEGESLLIRFTKVFEMTYKRFLDLQKAEAQAREAEIELALERVRAKAMAMQKPSEFVDVVNVIGQQFVHLGFDIEWANFGANGLDVAEGIDTWNFAVIPGGEFVSGRLFIPRFDHPVFIDAIKQLDNNRSTGNDLFVISYGKKEKDRWLDHLFTKTIFKDVPEQYRAIQYAKPGYTTSNLALKDTFLSIGKFDTISFTDEQHAILRRFGNAFGQAYTRFLDLQNAEAQARESQIQLALERVRARTMAMQHSEELAEVATILFQQVKALGVSQWVCGFSIWEIGDKEFTWYPGNPDGKILAPCKIPLTEHPVFISFDQSRRRGDELFVYEKEGEFQADHYRYMMSIPGMRALLQDMLDAGLSFPTFQIDHIANFSHGNLVFITYEPVPEMHDVFKRFAKVFEQTYTRFLDLQNAEAQAREGQIELGLERVRARAMAMQKSDELSELVDTVFKELTKLDFALTWCIINIIDEPSLSNTVWAANPDINKAPESYHMLFEDYPFHHAMMKGWKERKTKYVYVIEGEEKKIYDEYLFTKTEFRRVPAAAQAASRAMEKYVVTFSFSNFGGLQTVGDAPLSEDSLDILSRFGKVFDLTYTRFNDLKLAEAQAREARIEAVLERIRSRTMAMQKSDELTDVAGLLFKQVTDMGIKTWTAGFNVWSDDNNSYVDYITSPNGGFIEPYTVYTDTAEALTDISNARKSGVEFDVQYVEGEKIKQLYLALTKLDEKQYEIMLQDGIRFPSHQYEHFVFGSKVSLMFITYEPVPEAHDIFKRLGKVFEQTYTRFLDLQKAEAQAREAQIQLALERIRAKSLAMHHTSELQEVVNIVAQQLHDINIDINGGVFICINDEVEDDLPLWASGGAADYVQKVTVPFLNSPVFITLRDAIKRKNNFFTEEHGYEEKIGLFEHLFKYPPWNSLSSQRKQELLSRAGGYTRSVAVSNHTSIAITNHHGKKFSDDDNEVLKRFGNVFEQSYTRFLDLQKAEAQAREAQIEAALEKVRSRSLAMHESDELQEVVNTVFERLKELNVEMDSCNIAIFKEGTREYDYWIASPVQKRAAVFYIPYIDLSLTKDLVAAREAGESYSAKAYSFEEKNEWFNYAFEHTDFKFLQEERKQFILNTPGITVAIAFSKHAGVQINRYANRLPTDSEAEILKRFAKVFEQAYTRFLDLQNAEANAREAQVEASLERVRAKAMAMHKSDDLHSAVATVFEELEKLRLGLIRCGIAILDKEKPRGDIWIMMKSGKGNNVQVSGDEPLHIHPLLQGAYEAWLRNEDFTYILQGEDLQIYYEAIAKTNFQDSIKSTFDATKPDKPQYYFNAAFQEGSLFAFLADPITVEVKSVMKRFANVFNLTYKRFLDLQKAETQAREAKIEAALERVRAASMAMHETKELINVATVLYQQLLSLGFDRVVSGGFNFPDEINNVQKCWLAQTQSGIMNDFVIKLSGDKVLDERIECRKKNIPFLEQVLIGKEVREHLDFLFPPDQDTPEIKASKDAMPVPTVFSIRYLKEGYMILICTASLSEVQKSIMDRFAGVFNLAYIRFLDLQKAEAQAKEARIEIALERIRARALAMHSSNELVDVAKVMREQMAMLGQPELESTVVHLYEEDPDHIHSWRAFRLTTDTKKEIVHGHMSIPKNSSVFVREWLDMFYSNLNEYTIELSGTKQEEWYKILGKLAPDVVIAMQKDNSIHEKRYYQFSKFSGGALLMISKQQPSEESRYLLRRAAIVFDLAYRRFGDLQKAEAQAREAQIEVGLERVRARTMAMHSSTELDSVIKTVYSELKKLDISFERCFIMIFDQHKGATWWMGSPDDNLFHEGFYVPYHTYPPHLAYLKGWEERQQKWEYWLGGKIKKDWDEFIFTKTGLSKLPPVVIQTMRSYDAAYLAASFENFGCMTIGGPERISEESYNILSRFAKVFDLSYTRFRDLQTAEAQAREAQIELGLERVRARAMAMQNSHELKELIGTVAVELGKLDITLDRCFIVTYDPATMDSTWWMANPETPGKSIGLFIKYHEHSPYLAHIEAWKQRKLKWEYILEGETKKTWDKFLFVETELSKLPPPVIENMRSNERVYLSSSFNNFGYLSLATLEPLTEKQFDIMLRFAKVFDLTYTRFNDLQKAEAQARESQIEASLERVRAKAMAMHSSQDLVDTINVFYHQMASLSVMPIRCGIGIADKETQIAELSTMNTTQQQNSIEVIGKLHMSGHPVLKEIFENWITQTEYHPILREREIDEYYDLMRTQVAFPDYPNDLIQFGHFFYFSEGWVYAWTNSELKEDELKIYRRFTSVLSLTYKRYKDLKQAEAQAREAQIEAGLERVRARTMAMHSSEDVSAATATMFTELEKLGIENYRGGITNIFSNRTQEVWSVNNLAEGKSVKAVGSFNIDAHPFWQLMYGEWEAKKDFTYYFLAGQDKENYIKILNATQGYLPEAFQQFPDVHFQVYYFNEGAVWTNSLHPHTEEEKQIMKRFTSVFSLTFRRYQDLKNAEAQAREATIEAALEKVRGKAMAMHTSNDLSVTASMVFTELRKLDISPMRCGVGILNKEHRKAQLYSATASEEGDSLSLVGWVLLDINPTLKTIYDKWIAQEDYFPVLKKEMLQDYYEHLKLGFEIPGDHTEYEQHGYFLPFSEGQFYGWADKPFSEEEIRILKRFASVIDLTFRRYIELQKSEANTKEAVKQAALDRIRADIASMRTVSDLNRITPLIWNELTILGIPFIRCGVFIMDETQQIIHTYLSTPEGKAIAAFHLPYDTPGNLRFVVNNWKDKTIYIDHWNEIEFHQFAEILAQQGALDSAENYLKTIPKGGFYLHFLPFLQGMLYVGNTDQLTEDQIELIQHVADAFSTAYARYEDFNKLEAAKQQVEKTLTDLKQTQQQLVQSEKMASLGELTAGIAHEIQNPLNFVNNFSDVSNEMIQEMKDELAKGNLEEAIVIANEVRQNLDKILHHGKRADAIVKGMLQHSRTSSGVKEPTDINALCDEYLRLSYHGLRAKDKSFNAKFETLFDLSIEKINIVPQDIGRVVLNLINNAFYAVTEKKKHGQNGYEPVVTVSTKKENGKIIISIKDNGNGIPDSIKEKIFQPFFTTKPTGQGTGLGLSLSFDIVKAHGGELKVETNEGEGSEFIIVL